MSCRIGQILIWYVFALFNLNFIFLTKEKDANPSYEPEQSLQKSPRGIDNPGFWKNMGDLSFDVEQNILPRKQV